MSPLPCALAVSEYLRLRQATFFAALLFLAVLACSGGETADEEQVSDPLPEYRLASSLIPPSSGLPRYVLAVFDSSEERTAQRNEIHEFAELIINHLGYGVHFVDVNTQQLPPPEEMAPYAGIITWFQDGEMRHPRQFLDWIEANVAAGRKYILLGSLGTTVDSDTGETLPPQEATRHVQALGAESRGNFTDNPNLIELLHKEPMVEYERPLELSQMTYDQIVSLDPANEPWLSMNRIDLEDGRSDFVFVGPNGGFARQGSVFWIDLISFRRHLLLDLFSFFEQALGRNSWPRPDVTTLNGGRVLYTHIDGDGLRSQYEADNSLIAAETLYDEILSVYPYLVTASVVLGDVDSAFAGTPRSNRAARKIFALDNVEAASHSRTHPFTWRGDELLVEWERQAIETWPRAFDSYSGLGLAFQSEITDTFRYINDNLMPEGKKARVMLWTGQANPSADALREAERAGVFNLNGGLGRMDAEYDSVTWLAPLIAQAGGMIQYYATNPNDNNYSNLWSGPFEGLRNVLDTFANTEAPRRLIPMNVYYHFFSGTKDASLSALRQIFTWMEGRDVTSLFASEYIATVQGFLTAAVQPLENGSWRVTDYGEMRTFRFDDPEAIPDLVRSENLVGYRRVNDSIYVFVGAGDAATIVPASPEANQPHLEFCGCHVDGRRSLDDTDSYDVIARIDTELRIAGVVPGTAVAFMLDGNETGKQVVTASGEGTASITVPKGTHLVEVGGHR